MDPQGISRHNVRLARPALLGHSIRALPRAPLLHPVAPPSPPLPSFIPPLEFSCAHILRAIASFPTSSLDGQDGMRLQFVQEMLRSTAALLPTQTADCIATLTSVMIQGRLPLALAPLLTSAKHARGIRRIAIGLTLR